MDETACNEIISRPGSKFSAPTKMYHHICHLRAQRNGDTQGNSMQRVVYFFLVLDKVLRLVCVLIETVRLMDFRVGNRSTLSLSNILPSTTSLGKLSTNSS